MPDEVQDGGPTGGRSDIIDLTTDGGKRVRLRKVLATMQRSIERGDEIDIGDFDANVRYARSLREDPTACPREKLRAIEFLESIRVHGVNVATKIHDSEAKREAAAVQVNVATSGDVVFNVPPPRALGS